MENYQIVKFRQYDLEIDVNISPSEETVWLSKDQMAILFERDRSVISRHISNIYKEGEIDKSTSCAKIAHEVNGQIHYTEFFNLDVVISVGYRVKSKNGIIFRKWANKVLSEYLIKGFIINENRTLVTNENYLNLINKVNSIDKRLLIIEDNELDKEKIFFNGEMFDAKSFISSIIFKAEKSVILIDSYADIKTLDFLKHKKKDVNVFIYYSQKSNLSTQDISDFNLQYGGLSCFIKENYHDRFLIIDKEKLFHLGASLNYAGKKTFIISKIENYKILDLILNDLDS